jgi:hypothetical protein
MLALVMVLVSAKEALGVLVQEREVVSVGAAASDRG